MDVKLPQLAEGVESGTVVNIMVSEGQEIKKDQPFMELETQKAVGSIPAPNSGVVTKIHVKQGMEVSVGQVLISIETGAAASTAPAQTQPSQGSTSTPAAATSAPSRLQQTSVAPSPPSATAEDYHYQSASGVPPPAPPTIRKIARELGIDLTRVRGSEAGGRITMSDLRASLQRLQQTAFQSAAAATPPSHPATTPAPSETVDFSKWGPVRREKMSP